MIRTFNKLEIIPREFYYKGKLYSLRVWVNAWGEICVGYKEFGSDNVILSYVVQPNHTPYHPDLIEKTETSGLNEHIGNDRTLDLCLNAIEDKIMSMREEFKVAPNKCE